MAILWDKIGPFHFAERLSGDLDPPGIQVTPITRPWENGDAFASLGAHGEPTDLSFIAYAQNAQDANQLVGLIKQAQAKIYAIRINEVERQDYLLIRARTTNRRTAATTVGGVFYTGTEFSSRSSIYVVTCEFTVQYAGVVTT